MRQESNYTALQTPVTKQQIYDRQRADDPVMTKNIWLVVIIVIAVGFGALRVWALDGLAGQWATVFLRDMGIAAVIGLVIWRICVAVAEKATERRIRFENFARDNQLTYLYEQVKPEFPGIIFSSGSQRLLYDRFLTDKFEIGNYRYTVQHGKSSTTYKYGYIRIALERHVVHMLLDAKSNNTNVFGLSISNLPVTLNKDQTLSLEGNFDDYFTLYAPKEYERDALYIFTPDLMALLIDEAAQFDVEVIDDQLFIYGKEFQLMQPQTWQRVFEIITTIGKKTFSQTDYYADEKVGNRSLDVVAEPGRRLRQGVPWYVVAFTVLWILGYILQIVLNR
jgi:hypothetical protein